MANRNGVLICGGLLVDRYMLVDKYPERGEDGCITGSFNVVGGCTANIAKTVKNLGAVPYAVSFVGSDTAGSEIIDFMHRERLPVDCVRRTEGGTGYCMVFLEPDGERTFLTRKGCETEYSDSLICGSVANACSVVAVTGYYLLDDSSEQLTNRIRVLKGSGSKILFDPCPLVDKINKNRLEEMLSLSDVITPNKAEAKFLAGAKSPEQWALSYNVRGTSVIITEGGAGGCLYQYSKALRYDAIKADVLDTTGAGDSFTGAIAYALGKGMALDKAVALAASTAAVTASVKGPHCNFSISDLTPKAQATWKEHQSK
ncbi:MAG: carbohydrate kinase family protein [Clostridiales bacterium]|nr:carbohydrate kinase family protein [Clostridiales bacterium]